MAWLDIARRVKASHSFAVVSESGEEVNSSVAYRGPDDESDPGGSVVLDAQTASLLVSIHEALSPEKRLVFASMPLLRAVRVAWRVVALQAEKAGAA